MHEWRYGDRGWMVYTYTSDRGTIVEVEVVRVKDRRGNLTVSIPSLFGCPFRALCWPHQIYESREKAMEVEEELQRTGTYRDRRD